MIVYVFVVVVVFLFVCLFVLVVFVAMPLFVRQLEAYLVSWLTEPYKIPVDNNVTTITVAERKYNLITGIIKFYFYYINNKRIELKQCKWNCTKLIRFGSLWHKFSLNNMKAILEFVDGQFLMRRYIATDVTELPNKICTCLSYYLRLLWQILHVFYFVLIEKQIVLMTFSQIFI